MVQNLEPWTTLPVFPGVSQAAASTAGSGGDYPFGIWFANTSTLYVCDEGSLNYVANQKINDQVNVADAGSLATAGLQKWVLQGGTWTRVYVIQAGLNIGAPYSVKDYPASITPAVGGCRNIAGRVNHDGTATIYAVTSTISQNGDNGADPNTVVKVTDAISANKLATGDGDHDRDDRLDVFTMIAGPRARVAYRGVALAPEAEGHSDRD